MTNHPHSIPEPVLPEHQLLADAAPTVELSAGFRSKVMTECAASYALAQKIFYAKVIATVLLVICAVVGTYVLLNRPAGFDPVIKEIPQDVQPKTAPLSTGSLSTGSLSSGAVETGVTTDGSRRKPTGVETVEEFLNQ